MKRKGKVLWPCSGFIIALNYVISGTVWTYQRMLMTIVGEAGGASLYF
jgi:hypothetical protein